MFTIQNYSLITELTELFWFWGLLQVIIEETVSFEPCVLCCWVWGLWAPTSVCMSSNLPNKFRSTGARSSSSLRTWSAKPPCDFGGSWCPIPMTTLWYPVLKFELVTTSHNCDHGLGIVQYADLHIVLTAALGLGPWGPRMCVQKGRPAEDGVNR